MRINTIISKFNIGWKKKMRTERVEIYNLKNKNDQTKFKELTNNNNELSMIFEKENDLDKATNLFLNKLNENIKCCFNKIRITEKYNKELEELFTKRKRLRNKNDESSKKELQNIEAKLVKLCAESNYSKINEEISNLKCEEGGINVGKLWKLKKKLSSKCRDPPTAMLDKKGNLITSPKQIEALAVEVFKDRLENRQINDELAELKKNKETLCTLRLEQASNNKTPDWTIEDLEKVLKYLKNNKSRDPYGYINELFKSNSAGSDMKIAVLKLMNRIKTEQKYPQALEIANISAIYKNKGAKNVFESYRGIFRVPILRTILDRLIYNDEYDIIEENLSDSNVGARKGRNVRDNILVLNAITNSIVNGNEDAVDVQIFDIEKCFDKLWVEECVNYLFTSGFKNDKLPLLFKENQNALIAVKTSTGISKRISIRNIIMQGTVWGSLCCTVSMEKLGKLIYKEEDLTYKYKGKIEIPTLGMVDDILAVQKCSKDVIKINAVVNAFVESKKLKLSENKCQQIHIAKKTNIEKEYAILKVHEEQMQKSNKQKYLGDIVDESGRIRKTIDDRKNKGYGIVSEILAIMNDIPLGQYKMEIALRLRQAMLINTMLFNSEAWHDIKEVEIKSLECVDQHLLRSIVGAHSKTPLEFLYLETGAIPVRFILACRRMLYLQTILKRPDSELTKRIYIAQKEKPTKGDFYCLVEKDFQMIGEILSEDEIIKKSRNSYKNNIKLKTRIAAFSYLKEQQNKHSKIRNIQYTKLDTQAYMISPLFSNTEVSLLFALRSKYIDCKSNFKFKYNQDNLLCQLCGVDEDSQPHILQCNILRSYIKSEDIMKEKVDYNDIFRETGKQKVIVTIFSKLLEIRRILLNQENTNNPSMSDDVLEKRYYLQPCIVNVSLGN